ncbi:DUF4870 domain-containing protein [Dactylosporangium roseum]|uniref:DUF4870 domain-containing protein n=1 Tax=Dactylosporangium roseum TaxID=47989 RepID=A0ABY5Z174_9ACTN|nr:DUF4870 domain-containing protein [Dactylosporangium roseum]UWZ35552.1 DUF4870 domain-containing protein [Dactylosporangium roseum]
MSEPPRPGDYGSPSDPNSTPPSYSVPGEAPGTAYPPPTSGAGYGPPPTSGAGYQQPGNTYGAGYQPGTYGAPGGAPVGYANSDEKTWALIAHFGGILVGFIAPLVALLVKGNESPTVKAHANESLNFQLTWGVGAMIISVVLGVCSFGILIFLPFLVWIFILVFAIIAGMKANNGELYRYPATFRFLK